MGFEDRRQFPRFPCRYTTWVDGPRGPSRGTCTDLSLGGAFIEGITGAVKDAVVAIAVEFPGGHVARFEAQVRRVDNRGVGVQFMRLEPQAVELLQRYASPSRAA